MDKKNKIVINLLRISAFLIREGNRIAAKYGLNQQQFVVLNYIIQNQPVNQNQICSSLVFEKSNISKIIKKLEKLKFIEINNSIKDKRSMLIVSTNVGDDIIKTGLKEFNSFNNQLLNGLSEDEISNALLSSDILSQSIRKNLQ